MRHSFGTAVVAIACLVGSVAAGPALAQDEAELSRSERRELRRAEREAERAAEQTAQEAGQSQAEVQGQVAAQAEGGDDEGLICRRESVTGTHRRVRICTTAAQREAMRNASTEVIRDISRNRGRLGPEGQ